MKYVIARNEGPVGATNSKLIQGHKYEVLYISYPSSKERHKLTYNPREPKFFIIVKDDTGINSWSIWHTGEQTYWNDYFLSTEEMREMKLETLLK
jgi:hypothetical protein